MSERPSMHAILLALGCLAAASTGGCRCNKETLAPVVFGDQAGHDYVDPKKVPAPRWTPPSVSSLGNGAILHWLAEDNSRAFHIRVLLPTAIDAEKLDAAGTAVALEALQLRLQARVRRIDDARVDLRSRPGRIEVAIHGRDRDADRIIAALAESLADAGNPKLLAVAQGKVLARHGEPDPAALAAAGLVARLLDHDLEHEFASKQDVVDQTKVRLDRAWSLLTDPRDAVVVVHASRPFDDPERPELGEAVERLGDKWKAPLGFGSGKRAATARLRPEPPEVEGEHWLFTESSTAPLLALDGPIGKGGRAEVMIGRLIPTPTPEDRALARLCQRLMQEELDARLIVAGPVSLLAVRVRISPSDPIRSLERIAQRMRAFSETVHPRNRLEVAAELWLGARMVESSLQGEDWTSLWSASIDLAGQDREIFSAIAKDASGMLEIEPEQVQAFFAKWMDPTGGEPGWTWVAVGLDDGYREKLAAKVRVVAY